MLFHYTMELLLFRQIIRARHFVKYTAKPEFYLDVFIYAVCAAGCFRYNMKINKPFLPTADWLKKNGTSLINATPQRCNYARSLHIKWSTVFISSTFFYPVMLFDTTGYSAQSNVASAGDRSRTWIPYDKELDG